MIAKELPANTAIMAIAADRFNQRFHYRWQRIIEFLKLHTPNSFIDYHVDKEIAWFDGVSSEHIHNFCENLYDLTQKYH